jgi:hypothetical protein
MIVNRVQVQKSPELNCWMTRVTDESLIRQSLDFSSPCRGSSALGVGLFLKCTASLFSFLMSVKNLVPQSQPLPSSNPSAAEAPTRNSSARSRVLAPINRLILLQIAVVCTRPWNMQNRAPAQKKSSAAFGGYDVQTTPSTLFVPPPMPPMVSFLKPHCIPQASALTFVADAVI